MSGLPLDDARRRIDASIVPIRDVERVPLAAALGRVLAADVLSPIDVPPHDNAAMDGYALAAGGTSRLLRVVGTVLAGKPWPGTVDADACVRIMTGATMPAGCDAIVAFEDAVVVDGALHVDAPVVAGRHRRSAGEDLHAGDVAVPRARRLGPADLAVAASVGATALDVVRRPRIALLSTGNELRDVGTPLAPGAIYDANRTGLAALLADAGVEIVDLGIVRDETGALAQALDDVDGRVDAVVTSGGVSGGDADHVRAVVAARGTLVFHALAIKPGRPMAFGRLRASWFFALPGNPAAAIVVFHALVRDALAKLAGIAPAPRIVLAARVTAPLAKTIGRTEFVRGALVRTRDGWDVAPSTAQGAGMLRSLAEADAMIMLPDARGPVAAGDVVEVWPLRADG